MKRIVFRTAVVGVILALGLLTIAHAQRTDTDAPADNGAANPLRNGPPNSAESAASQNRQSDAAGPIDTDIPQRDNPLLMQIRRLIHEIK